MSAAPVLIETDGPVTTIGINRPPAATRSTGRPRTRWPRAFRDFDADPTASVAVLHGEGGPFCPGPI